MGKKVEYTIFNFDGWFNFICVRSRFIVDTSFVEKFKAEFPGAVEVKA